MFWVALAAQISMPLPDRGYILDVFNDDQDTQISLVPMDEFRRVDVRVTVGPDGKIQRCRIEASSEIARLDALTCAIIQDRAKLHPAIGSDGSPSYGVIRETITWAINTIPPPAPGDLELTVKKLPRGVKSPARVPVMFAVDEGGHLSSCTEESRPWKSAVKKAPDLLKIACDAIGKSYAATPALDATGKSVRSIQNAVVQFVTDRR